MFPGFGYKHSYPQAMPPQMKMGASNSPFTHETWPHHYGYPVPPQFHSCCNHNYPNYNPSTPLPYSHIPLYPQYYYPIYPEPYPFQYAPPPHYTMELPKYEYDKTIPHCCRCDHVKPELNGEDKCVKIGGNGSGDENREGFLKNQELPSDSTKLSGDGERDSRLSGWVPLDMDNLKRLLQNGKLRKDEDDQPMNQMPFPMIWLPCKNEEKMDKNGERTSLEKSEKPLRTIHVKQLDENDDMKTDNGLKAKNSEEEKKDTKSKPSSPTKGCKLPPICLRIDPLPKKKTGNGKSRSPSPPRDKVKPVEVAKPSSSIVEKEVVEVNKPSKVAGNVSESKEAKEKKPEKKMLSGAEAATIIQSAYRGYEVRRWEPLKKMRQIASIRDEALALMRCIEASDESMDLKQKTALGETIMSLLLKLDTIQGLHSSMRDMRKSVAKELVSLQEMLDAIVIKQQQPTDHFHGATKDKNSSLQLQEASELKSGEMIHEQQAMESEKDAASMGEEVGKQLLAGGLVSEQYESTLECKPIDNESSHVGHVDSGSQTDMNLYLLDELPEKLLESDQEASKDEAIMMEPVKVESQVEVDKLTICSTENNKAKEDDESDQRRVMEDEKEKMLEKLKELEASELDAIVIKQQQPADHSPVSKTEDHGATKDKISSLQFQEASELESGEMIHEQQAVESEKDAASIGEEVGRQPSAGGLVSEQYEFAAREDSTINNIGEMQEAHDPAPESEPINPTSDSKPIDKESSLVGHVDSASQTDMNLDLLDELPVGVMEDSDVRTGEKVCEDAVTWPGNIVEFDKEASVIMEDEDVKAATTEESADYCNVAESGESDQKRVMEDENGKMRELLEKMIASGKEQQQVIFSLNQKLKELEAKLAKQKENKKKKKKGSRTRKLKLRF
ncbi:hypothetical protein V2J09_002391 [Rumex salicifolius]